MTSKTMLILALLAVLSACPSTSSPGAADASPDADVANPLDASDASPSDAADSLDSADAADAADAGDTTELPPLDLVGTPQPGQARAGVIVEKEALLVGPKADGQLGDLKIFNNRVAFVIEGVRLASGYRFWGGGIADVAAKRADGSWTQDNFGEVAQTWNLMIFEPQSFEVLNDGRDGKDAHVRLRGIAAPMAWADSFLSTIISAPQLTLDVVYDYILAPDAEALRQDVTVTNRDSEDADVDLPILLSSQDDGMYHWRQGPGFSDDGGAAASLTMGGREAAHALYSEGSDLTFLLQTTGVMVVTESSFKLAPDEALVQTYYRAVSAEGINGVERIGADLGVAPPVPATVGGSVALPDSAAQDSGWVVLYAADKPFSLAPVRADGSYSLAVPEGDYRVQVYVPNHAAPAPADVTATAAAPATADFTVASSATLEVVIKDASGAPVDARVMAVVPADDTTTPTPYAPGEVAPRSPGAWNWSGGFGRVSAVGYAAGGSTTLVLPVGTYEVRATRGFFYSVDVATVTVTAGDTNTPLALTIGRVIDTTGWVGGDFHIHALRSPDSHVPHDVRVLQALTEGLEAPVMTEHVALHTLGPNIEALGLQDKIATIPGQEVSTVEYGHFNAFPLEYRPNEPNGGGVVEYGRRPAELIQGIADQGTTSPFVQVNHPRSTAIKGFFTWAGFDATTGLPTKHVEDWTTAWDGIEVFNGGCGVNQEFDDWVALTNMGLRKALSSGSDSHDESDPIGYPRQIVNVDFATVAGDAQALADAVRARKSFVSCGPFVVFETVDGAFGMGDMAPVATDGSVSFRVQVQAPAWQDLVEVRVRENGVVIDVLPITETAPGVRLDTTVTVNPAADAWYMLEVVGSGTLMPVQKSGPPAAFTNPIEVDADGDGEWTPPGL